MVNQLLETSHPISSSALRPCGSVADPSSILRTHFQVPYPVSLLLASLLSRAEPRDTKTPGVTSFKPKAFLPPCRCAVDRLAKAGDNSLSAQTLVGAPITEEGE